MVCVCVLGTGMICAKTAKPIEMPFDRHILVGSRNHESDEVQIPHRKWHFWAHHPGMMDICSLDVHHHLQQDATSTMLHRDCPASTANKCISLPQGVTRHMVAILPIAILLLTFVSIPDRMWMDNFLHCHPFHYHSNCLTSVTSFGLTHSSFGMTLMLRTFASSSCHTII